MKQATSLILTTRQEVQADLDALKATIAGIGEEV